MTLQRVFAPITAAELAELWRGRSVHSLDVQPLRLESGLDSDDIDERAEDALALVARVAVGRRVVVAADVELPAAGSAILTLADVAAVFVGEDDTPDAALLWYASQEIPAICAMFDVEVEDRPVEESAR